MLVRELRGLIGASRDLTMLIYDSGVLSALAPYVAM